MTLNPELAVKYDELKALLKQFGSVLIAYSGGVDSALLLKVAVDVLADRVVAVTAKSVLHSDEEFNQACDLARRLGVRHIIVETDELQLPEVRNNPPDRCYHCKRERFSRMVEMAQQMGIGGVCDGTNKDDYGQYRPGMRAKKECGVFSPLAEAGFSKSEIRELSRALGLPTWNKQPMSCLATRFPYNHELSHDELKRVARAEEELRHLQLSQLRVRYDGDTARIEVLPEDFEKVVSHAAQISLALREMGFRAVTLDLAGYRSGSRDEEDGRG